MVYEWRTHLYIKSSALITVGLVQMSKWYKSMFEGKMVEHWLQISDLGKEQTEEQVAFLRETLKDGLTLDHCCGPGRLSIPLSRDKPIVGFDLSRFLLNEARKRGRRAVAKNLHLIRADMRHLPLQPNSFENVLNFWTSFGYFSDKENMLVLKEIARVLRTNGMFVMHIANPEGLIREYREKDWSEEERFFRLEQRNWDWESKRMKCRWIFIDKAGGEISEIHFDHRLYSFNELKRMFEKEGLKVTDAYASFNKEKPDPAVGLRMIIIAQK